MGKQLSFSFSPLLVFLLLYVPSTTIAKKDASKDPVPCKRFYDEGRGFTYDGVKADWRGGTDCWCTNPNDESIGNNSWWYSQGQLRSTRFKTGVLSWKIYSWFSYIQSDGPFARSWYDCDVNTPGIEEPNVEWAVRNCKDVPSASGVAGWGNAYETSPTKKIAPYHVNYAMRCEYPGTVAPNCLCPNKNHQGTHVCGKTVRECTEPPPLGFGFCVMKTREWGKKNYSSPEYCRKLNVIVDRPLGQDCDIHAHCALGLQCDRGACNTCPDDVCPDRYDKELELWGATMSYGDYKFPETCIREGLQCNPHYTGVSKVGCCRGLTCDPETTSCILDDCKKDGPCTGDNDNICPGFFCLNNKVVNGEGRECFIEENGVSSNCTISGTFCDPEWASSICTLLFVTPTQTYKPRGEDCDPRYHSTCDEGLYCDEYTRTCATCQVDRFCPEKYVVPNSPTCKYGEYLCPHSCSGKGRDCGETNGEECCRGLKCVQSTCVEDSCKKTGTCSSDDECCDGYGCLNGTVVYAVGQYCDWLKGEANYNCTDSTLCDKYTNTCERWI